jgi:hypothetical protein
MKSTIALLIGCIIAGTARAEEPSGCDKFKWPVDNDRTLLTSKGMPTMASGSSVVSLPPVAVKLALEPFAAAKLPLAPERAPRRPASFAGFIRVPAPAHGGTYKVSVSSDAWIDVVQNGRLVKSRAFTGARDCEGIRKSVKFDLKAEPFVVQLSNVASSSITLAISGD